MKLPLARVAELLGVSREGAGGDFDRQAVALGYSIDSRTVRPGELFFAVKGEKMDGHDFVEQALEKGAVAAVVSREKLPTIVSQVAPDVGGERTSASAATQPGPPLVAVEDSLVALQTLATAVRRLWARSLIAVTGSAGKT